ncbi:MAG: multidrug efflux protein [Hydrocarboniphaga sp.]|uniref:efflux RND transporter permease subunit n=1 Tax=Hydrocarboniphaga sp. TaxID=2033016 RepID=UPI00260DA888|nr:efflux RND transporter permease subunit [Hydrocarboniphaga sp.]MDB5970874.1 multidrug efflux protein [Hydrocarboniphaga sp.]
MHFTDIFIKRPVLASVISLVILLLGLRAATTLTIREYPYLQNAQVNVTVAYPGADASLMEGFITTPLEREIATADGIDFLTSSSAQGLSTITANLRLNKNPNEAITEISAKVNKLRSQLPQASDDPVVELTEAGGTASMYLSFYSDVLDASQINDYVTRIVLPQLAAIPGVQRADLQGGFDYALRVWLRGDRLAAHNLTAGEVTAQIRNQNVIAAVGETKGADVRIGISARTDLRKPEDFEQLVVKTDGASVTRLKDVADVQLGSSSYDGGATWNLQSAVFIGIKARPDANVLEVTQAVKDMWPSVHQNLPQGLEARIAYDGTDYVRDAVKEVQKTLAEAMIIVIVVIFLFLGSIRNSMIPAVTVPLSLMGGVFFMLVLGYSFNLLTLLAMVLAIGMVVDDAIIVMENIHRHMEDGMTPLDASIRGARELVGPVIAMTITLVSVYAPIGFLTGITGKLFSEFAFTLAASVFISGVIALTLTPMMCSKLLRSTHGGDGVKPNKLALYLDGKFETWRHGYKQRLHGALNTVHVIGVFGAIVFASCFALAFSTPGELAPQEDFGFAFAIIETDGYSTMEYMDRYFMEVQKVAKADPSIDRIFGFTIGSGGNTNQSFMGMIMKPWKQHPKPTDQVLAGLMPKMAEISGVRFAGIQPPALPTPGQGYPVEFVLKSTADPVAMSRVADEVVGRAMASKKFFYAAPNLRIDRPEAVIDIDRDKAALMGVSMQQLSADLSALFAGGEVNRFSYDNRSYKVIQQVQRAGRLDSGQIDGFYTRAASGELVPISTLVKVSERVVPRSIEHSQQLNSVSIIAVPRPDVTQGDALAFLEKTAQEIMPSGYQLDYAGASRQFKQEGSALLLTFAFALIVIYLVLAAQFESFTDPLIMLVTVPMSICGALLLINIFSITNGMQLTHFPGMTLNIYTEVGLVTLIGVISKHGILIVEFANKLQQQGMAKRDAIEEAASIRLRPVLMTTAALVIGMVPLLSASGPGAASRFCIGLVIAAGMFIGTLFTLYIVPAAYLYIGRDYAKIRAAKAPTAALVVEH